MGVEDRKKKGRERRMDKERNRVKKGLEKERVRKRNGKYP